VRNAAGPEVEIMDEEGQLLTSGEIGEVVIRGANVTQGYENNPQANQTAFTDGWFRTGDLGSLDADNYLFLKGRIKEIINRGGEKISPREVDEVLLDYPAIEQVALLNTGMNLDLETLHVTSLHRFRLSPKVNSYFFSAKPKK